MQHYLYVSLLGEDKIVIFSLDSETGKLESKSIVTIPGGPAPLAIDPTKKFLYSGLRDSYQIASFRIDQNMGNLSFLGAVPLDANPCFLATDRKGRFLLSSYYHAGSVAVHLIGEDGVVKVSPVESLSTAENAHSIQTDPSNRFAFIPHTGPNLILQCVFDEHTGRLDSNPVPSVIPEEGSGPRHFCFHPGKDLVYFVNELGSSVTAYNFDPISGCLSSFQMISTLPENYTGQNTCAQIQITPSGKFLYASNRGHDSIACFSIEAFSGQLTSLGQMPTEAIPRAFTLDPEGDFLFAAGRESGRLASYRINPQTGELTPLEIYPVGKSPMWVLAVSL
jgi:6-phosphogluconolactonase